MRPTLLLLPLLASSLLQFHHHASASDCVPATCGNLTLRYPFWLGNSTSPPPSSCGHQGFEVWCSDDGRVASLKGSYIHILSIDYAASSLVATLAKVAGDDGVCQANFNVSSSITLSAFTFSPRNRALCFLYDCNGTDPMTGRPGYVNATTTSNCSTGGGTFGPIYAYLAGDNNWDNKPPAIETGGCNYAYFPVIGSEAAAMTAANYSRLLKEGFVLDWDAAGVGGDGDCRACNASGGQCQQYDGAEFRCLCRDGKSAAAGSTTCAGTNGNGWKIPLTVSISVATCLLLPCIYVFVWHRQKVSSFLCKNTSKIQQNIEDLILAHGSLAPKRYKYSEITKIKTSLNIKLGEGGYGMVFKGTLDDGRLVAVKFLHDSKGDGEEFVNEVMSIGRTSHINIVSLFGFCLEGSKRALIYEYMTNGSLDTYIYSENPKAVLGWEKLYNIAIGIARGLEYLHHSCNTRIVHFDIKPQNILLDQDFNPKIADFGLAKFCRSKESKLSMTGARGTIGFIAPEVHSRTFGVVSTKSDVYSYGMMLLEMVGGRKNVKSVAPQSSEKYFPHWIYDHFGQDDGLKSCEVTCENEGIAKKLSVIGLWCIQILPMHRPAIGKVLEMFERGLDELDMPPRQNFSQILEGPAYSLNADRERTSLSSDTKTQVSSEVPNMKEISVVNSKTLQRLPTL